jgi:hypothetical protein
MLLWARKLRDLYTACYSGNNFTAHNPEKTQEAHEYGLTVLEKLIGIVSGYSDELVYFTELELEPLPRPALEPNHASSIAGTGSQLREFNAIHNKYSVQLSIVFNTSCRSKR